MGMSWVHILLNQLRVNWALVLVQELFEINAYVRSVVDGYAKDRFLVVTSAIFDRFERCRAEVNGGEDQKRTLGFLRTTEVREIF